RNRTAERDRPRGWWRRWGWRRSRRRGRWWRGWWRNRSRLRRSRGRSRRRDLAINRKPAYRSAARNLRDHFARAQVDSEDIAGHLLRCPERFLVGIEIQREQIFGAVEVFSNDIPGGIQAKNI